jgi:hypothetical protein
MAFTDYYEAAKSLRQYIGDYPQLNTLDNEFETTDDELVDYVKDALVEINLEYEPRTYFKLSDIVVEPEDEGNLPWSAVRLGAILKYLVAKGILNARNYLTYSDAGGIQVTDRDRWGRYINFFNVLINKYAAAVKAVKLRQNIQDSYGGFSSPFSFDVY